MQQQLMVLDKVMESSLVGTLSRAQPGTQDGAESGCERHLQRAWRYMCRAFRTPTCSFSEKQRKLSAIEDLAHVPEWQQRYQVGFRELL